jgi:AAA family ATP:ADP antiporter
VALLISGALTILIFRWLNINVIRPTEKKIPQHLKPQKVKMSVRQNFLYIARSKYLICIAIIVVTYNLAMNLVEIVWKNKMKEFLPNPAEYNGYMGKVMIVMAIVATVTGLVTTSNVIRRFSWTTCAMISPVIIGATGLLFFAVVLLQEWNIPWFASLFGISPLILSVSLGSLQNCLSRASKYTVFDATKEIAFIPLSNQSKLKGKAAIDGIGSRLGKSGGSIAHQGLLIVFATIGASTPYVAAIFLGVIVFWGLAVSALGKQFDQLVSEDATIDVPENEKLQPILAKNQS